MQLGYLVAIGSLAIVGAASGSAFVANVATALPGDRLPSPGLPPVPAPGQVQKPYREPASTTIGPSLEQSMTMAQAALRACQADGFRVGVAVVDVAGQPRVMLAADQAMGGHTYTGVRKAMAALAFDAPTSSIPGKVAMDAGKAALVTSAMMPWPGAVPLHARGMLIGAIGVSGAASLQDERCAAAGARALGT